jgi:hypothetical protein
MDSLCKWIRKADSKKNPKESTENGATAKSDVLLTCHFPDEFFSPFWCALSIERNTRKTKHE